MHQRSNGSPRYGGLPLSTGLVGALLACASPVLSGCPGPDPTTGIEGDAGSDGGGSSHRHDAGPDDRDAANADAHRPDSGSPCKAPGDCISRVCTNGMCAAPMPTLGVAPAMLEFTSTGSPVGFVACGSSPSTETFTVTNKGTANLKWWTVSGLGSATPYVLSPSCRVAAPCAIAAGAAVRVTVTGPAVSASAGIRTFNDTLTVFSSALGDPGRVIDLAESSYGAVLAFSPTDQDFGPQPDDATYTQAIQLLNSGNTAADNVALTLTPSSSAEFSLSAATVNIPTTGGTFSVIFTPNDMTASVHGAVALGVGTTPLCSPLPKNLTLEGQGALPFAVTSSLNFNSGPNGNAGVGVSCGTTGPTLDVVATNNGTAAAEITALALGLGASSPYTVPIATTLPITVAAGASVNIPVVPKAIPASDAPALEVDDTLTVTTNASGDLPHVVSLDETTAGAVLALIPSSVVFSTTVVGTTASYAMIVDNRGNVAAPLTLTTQNSTGVFTFDSGIVAPAGGSASPNAYFTPTSISGGNTYSAGGTMAVATGTPLCASSPASVGFTLAGSGTAANLYGAGPGVIAFGTNTCGVTGGVGTPPPASAVTLTNTTSVPANFTATLGGAGAALFGVSLGSGVVPVAGMTTLSVTPSALGSTSGITQQEMEFGVPATVTVVIGSGATAETFVIPITEHPAGAYPVWSASYVDVAAGGGTASFALGNLWGTVVDFTITVPSSSGFSITAPAGNPPSGSASFGSPLAATVLDSNTSALTTASVSSGLVTPATTPLCTPLPTLALNPH
jgi:hypothetical protein